MTVGTRVPFHHFPCWLAGAHWVRDGYILRCERCCRAYAEMDASWWR